MVSLLLVQLVKVEVVLETTDRASITGVGVGIDPQNMTLLLHMELQIV